MVTKIDATCGVAKVVWETINIHTSLPTWGFFWFELPLLHGNFSSGLYIPFKILAFKTLLPLGVFSDPQWG